MPRPSAAFRRVMHRSYARTAACLLLACLPTGAALSADYVPNQLVAKLTHAAAARSLAKHAAANAVTGVAAVDALNVRYGCTRMQALSRQAAAGALDRAYLMHFGTAIDVKQAVRDYTATGAFEFVEPNYIGHAEGGAATVPNDPYFNRQWALYNDGSLTYQGQPIAKAGADIKMEQAWDTEQGDSAVIVAILDSGCKMAHAEFAGRIWRNAGEIPGNGIDDDHNGFIDDVQGWDFVDNDNNPEDSLGHGTSVASIIGANGNNGVGFAGVDWRCKLMIVRVIDSVGTEIMLAQGVGYAVQNGARVLNISLAFASASQLVAAAIDTARAHGAVVCAGTGNDGTEGVKFPANMDAVVAVGATNPDDTRCAPFFNGGGSNYGIAIDVVAPGNHIAALGISASTEYSQRLAGTSYSTALVSGLAALLLAQNPARTPVQIANIICWTADDQVGNPTEDTPGWDKYYGFGRINARAALAYNAGAVRPVTRGNAGGRGAAFRVRYTPGDGVTVVPAAGVAVVGMYSLLGRAVPLVSRVRDGGARVRAASAGGVWLVSTERAGRKEATPALLTP